MASQYMSSLESSLIDKKILVIGAGTTGSWVVPMLDKLPLKEIIVYDEDTVEEKNTEAQNFYENDIEKNKAEITADKCSDKTNAVTEFFKEETLLESIETDQIEQYDLIICAADSFKTREEIKTVISEYMPETPILDPRIGGLQLELYYYKRARAWDIPQSSEASPLACGLRYTPFVGQMISGLIGAMVISIFKGDDHPKKFIISLKDYVFAQA